MLKPLIFSKRLCLHAIGQLFFNFRGEEKKTVVDKKKQVRALIERIPSDKEDLFRFQVDWAMVDSVRSFGIFVLQNCMLPNRNICSIRYNGHGALYKIVAPV